MPKSMPHRHATPAGPKPSEALIRIDNDGSARELTAAEKTYVDTEFLPFDGARPYIKSRYEQRDGWGELKGFLHRRELPKGIEIRPAPPDVPSEPWTPEGVAAEILELLRKPRP